MSNQLDEPYATKDLFIKHPTIPDVYKYIGRIDDTLVMVRPSSILLLPPLQSPTGQWRWNSRTNTYTSHLKTFLDDAQPVSDNFRLYNPEGSVYVKHVAKLEKVVKELVADHAKRVA